MHNNKEESLKDLIKIRANDELKLDIQAAPIWDQFMTEMVEDKHFKNSIERKKQMMQMYKVELIDMIFDLESKNERLKTEVTEALAKRDYWQNLANREAADAKKAKQDCEKEMEWQRNKLQEFDYVLTKYKAKIKELEDANRFFKFMINLIIKE